MCASQRPETHCGPILSWANKACYAKPMGRSGTTMKAVQQINKERYSSGPVHYVIGCTVILKFCVKTLTTHLN